MHCKQKKFFLVPITLILVAIIAAGCDSGPRVKMAPGYETTPTRQDANANIMGTPEQTENPPTPTPEPLLLDDIKYTLPSQAFSLFIPQRWKLSSEDSNYARFESPDQKAWFEAAVESTGYQLEQEGFKDYSDAMLISLYSSVNDFEMLDRQVEEGRAIYTSSFRRNGVIWFVYDVFIQRSQAIYALSFQAYELVWEAYLPGFEAVVGSLETRTGYVTDEMVYSFMRAYNSPNNQFNLTAPMGWTHTLGQDLIKGAVVDVIESPDKQAAVEIVAYDGTKDLKTVDIGQIAIPIIKELHGADIRIRANEVLLDSRIRTDWQIDAQEIRAFSFFWQDESIVYILTFKYSEKITGAYQNVAHRIGDSFAFSDAD